MPRISYAFFGVAVIYGVIGMCLGIAMGMTRNVTLMPVHAHLNLLGWVSLAIMGGFYALAGDRAPKRLAWANFIVSNLGLWLCIPALALLLLGNTKVLPILMISEPLLVGGMILFAVAIVMTARAPAAKARPTLMQAA